MSKHFHTSAIFEAEQAVQMYLCQWYEPVVLLVCLVCIIILIVIQDIFKYFQLQDIGNRNHIGVVYSSYKNSSEVNCSKIE